MFALHQHAAQHGQVVVAAQGGERDITALLCLTRARRRVRTEQEESKRKIRSVHTSVPPAQVFFPQQAAPQAPRVVPRLLAPPGNRLVI